MAGLGDWPALLPFPHALGWQLLLPLL